VLEDVKLVSKNVIEMFNLRKCYLACQELA